MSRGLGYAFVAAQRTPLEHLVKPSAPERYASLGIEASDDLTPYAGPIIYEGNFGSAGPPADAVSLAPEQLAKLYDSHEDYVAKVSRRLDQLVGEGWILGEYAEELRAEADAAAIP
jgi:hypothetical protein